METSHGIPGKKWGIWNSNKNKFQFGIRENTTEMAEKALFKKIGYDAFKGCFEARIIPEGDT